MILTTSHLVNHVLEGVMPYQHALPPLQTAMPTSYFEGFHSGVKGAIQDLTLWAESQAAPLTNWAERLAVYIKSGLDSTEGFSPLDRRVLGYFDGYDVVLRAVARHIGLTV